MKMDRLCAHGSLFRFLLTAAFACGLVFSPQLADAAPAEPAPLQPAPLLGGPDLPFQSISAGDSHTCALRPDGSLVLASVVTGGLAEPAQAAGIRYAKQVATGLGNCTTWDDACTLQTALTGAVSGDEIWVMEGVYKPTEGTDRTATFQLKSDMAVYGGFDGTESSRDARNPTANPTILSGDIDNNDSQTPIIVNLTTITGNGTNSFHVVTGPVIILPPPEEPVTGPPPGEATLDGFVITAGNANGSAPPNNQGGGMYNYQSRPRVTNVTFRGNRATYGGGLYNGTYSNPILTDVTFSGNSATYGGGLYHEGTVDDENYPVLTRVTFEDNSATDGGGMYNAAANSLLINVTFEGNSASSNGGGMANNGDGTPVLNNVTFTANSAGAGGGIANDGSNVEINNSTFSGNSAAGGSGMFNNNHGGSRIQNTSFEGNTGTVIYNYNDSGSELVNVTISGNTGIAIHNDNYSSPSLTSVTISGNTGVAVYNSNHSDPALTNLTISGNGGSGVYNTVDSSPTLVNVTITGNGSGLISDCSSLGQPQVNNSIIWGNSGDELNYCLALDPLTCIFMEDTTVTDSAVEGGCNVLACNQACSNITTADPRLGTLGDFGGFTLTVPLLSGSSAINATSSGCPATDQRGVARDSTCDLGAYEVPGDATSPSLVSFTRRSPAVISTSSDVLIFRATFSEAVQRVDVTDFTVSGTTATVTLVSPVNASTYDITVLGGNLAGLNGTVGLNLSGSQNITDMVWNPLPASEPATDETYVVENIAPQVTSFMRQTPAASSTNADTLVFRATFNEAVQNVDASDFVAGGTTAGLTVASVNAGVYDITVTDGDLAGLNGTVGLDLAVAQDIEDQAGNSLPFSEPAIDETYDVNNIAPALISFKRQAPTFSPISADTLVFRVMFDEDVQNVDANDFAVSGTTAGLTVTPVGVSVYDITVSGGDLAGLNGAVGLDLAAAQDIADLTGNPLPFSEPAIDETYEVNNTAPLVASTNLSVAYAGTGPASFIVTFSEDVGNPAGDEDTDDVTNPANYRIINKGANGLLETAACNVPLGGDDSQILPSGVTYIPNTAIVNLGSALPVGTHRLFVCGTTSIVDLAGNHLNNGVDYPFDFVVSASASGGDGDGSRWNGANAQALPKTGFAPNVVTRLPEHPAELAYTKMSDLWLEIPSQKVKANIVGVPQSENVWDVKWLGNDTGWLDDTAFPSWVGNSVITAHVMGADGLPGPFAKLQDLKYGERVVVHMLDQQYVFEVRNKRLVRPDSTAYAFEHLEDASYLTLVTCSGYNEESDTYSFRRIIRTVLVEVK